MILTPEILLAVVGVNTVFGLLALLAYLFAYLKVQTIKNLEVKSIRETVEGEGIFNATQVISILQEFKSDATRLEALRELAKVQNKSQTSADRVYDKVKGAIDVAEIRASRLTQALRITRSAGPFFIALAILPLIYGGFANPDFSKIASEFLTGSQVQTFPIADIVGKDGEGNNVSNVSHITVTATRDRSTNSVKAFVNYAFYNGSGTWRGSQSLVLTFFGAERTPLGQLTVPLDRGKCVYVGAENRSFTGTIINVPVPIKSVEAMVTRVTGVQTPC